MITGRSFQGIGSGIILTVSEIILADLVSLSERLVFLLRSSFFPIIYSPNSLVY